MFMENVEYFEIGKIVNTQGVNGDVRVLPTTDEPNRFLDLETVLLDNGKGKIEYHIEKVWFHKQFVIIKFKEIENMTAAERLKGTSIKIDRKDALPLEDNEYYISDLYDMEVYTDDNQYIGIIKDILFTAANDVYIVENPSDKKSILIPAIKQCIVNVSVQDNKMIVHMMEGLGE
jgi:16S rRNA processing protein RimM